MLEENERRSEYPRHVRSTARNRKSTHDEKSKTGFGITGLQAVLCILILIVSVAVQLLSPAAFKPAKAFLTQALKTSITQKQFSQAVSQLKSLIPDAKGVFTASSSNSSAVGDGGNISSSKGSSASSSSKSNAASSSGQTASSSSAASSTVSNIVIGEDSTNGSGGEDLEANIAPDGTYLPPSQASFGPVKLSVHPIWPVSGRVTSEFGYRVNPITNKFSFHTGMDIAEGEGTPIKASLPGVVEDVGVNAAYGNYILISDGGNVETFYGHCESILKQKGDTVRQGDEIATVGSTGYSTGFHVHFEIRVQSISYNPKWILK